MLRVENEYLRLEFTEAPFQMVRISDQVNGIAYNTWSSELELSGAFGRLAMSDLKIRARATDGEGIEGCADERGMGIRICYKPIAGLPYAEKVISVKNTSGSPLGILNLRQSIQFEIMWPNITRYVTCGDENWSGPCPVGWFFNNRKTGLYWGMANPFFRMFHFKGAKFIDLDCALELHPGQEFVFEETVYGVHALDGKTYKPRARRPDVNWQPYSFSVNPYDLKLDDGEIRSLRRYVARKFPPFKHDFMVRTNSWTIKLPMRIDGRKAEADYKSAVDAIKDTPIDLFTIIGGWFADARNLPPEKQHDLSLLPRTDAVLRHAEREGVDIGMFVSVSVGDYRGRKPHAPNTPKWQIENSDGTRGPDVCLGNQEFLRWFVSVISYWIETYKVKYVSFDFLAFPECYDRSHGHLAGAGTKYLQWRGGVTLIEAIRKKFPTLVVSAQVGYMSTMPWSGKNASETHLFYDFHHSTLCPFHTLSMDQILGDNFRLNAWWKQYTSFLPSYRFLGLAGHYDRGNPAFDLSGWRYSILSALAIGAETIGLCNLPLKYEDGFRNEDIEFLNAWKKWARENQRFRYNATPILGEPGIGKIDGFAQIDGDCGFLFLFNPNPRTLFCSVCLDERIGLVGNNPLYIREIYPETCDIESAKGLMGRFPVGADVDFLLGPHSAKVVRLMTERPDGYPLIRNEPQGERFESELVHWQSDAGPVTLPNRHALVEGNLRREVNIPLWVRDELENRRVADYPKELTDFFPCVDPSRLLLELAFIRPEEIKPPRLWVNDRNVEVHGFYRVEKPEDISDEDRKQGRQVIAYWADLSGVVRFGEANGFKLETDHLEPGQFQGALLYNLYPSATTVAVPNPPHS